MTHYTIAEAEIQARVFLDAARLNGGKVLVCELRVGYCEAL